MGNTEVVELDWSNERTFPAFQAIQQLTIYDVRGASSDVQIAITTLVGIINRPVPRVYLVMGDDEQFWLKQSFGSIPQIVSPSTGNNALDALVIEYHPIIQGLVIYDPHLDDSINIATMIAGQRNAIVVSPALAQKMQDGYSIRMLDDLRKHEWKTRTQAYDWALQNLRQGASSRFVAGLRPTIMELRPFLVATRAFIYYLDSRKYLPDLSDGLLSERSLMQKILTTFSPETIHLGWFIDESSGVNLTSEVAIPVFATDSFTNLEVWSAMPFTAPAQAAVSANVATTAEKTVYVSFTISDGDNLQYSQHRMLALWRDNARGSVPIGWTISSALAEAASPIAEYYLSTATPNDEFIAGPSGAGYMFPSHWPAEHLASFLQRTGQQMQVMSLTTLEVLDTDFWQSSGLPFIADIRSTGMAFTDDTRRHRYAQALSPFGLTGIFSGAGLSRVEWKLVDGIPFYQNLGLADSVSKTVKLIQGVLAAHSERPLFLNVYLLAWKIGPSDIQQIVQQLGTNYKIVLPSQLLAMLANTLR